MKQSSFISWFLVSKESEMGVLESGWSRDNTEMGLVGRINIFFSEFAYIVGKQ